MKNGVDISEHNGPSFDVRGQEFIMIRASWGHFAEDLQVRNNVSKCLANGIPYGFYHYSYACNDTEAYQEARGFLNLSKQFSGRSYPLCLDMEDADGYKAGQGVSMEQEIRTIKIFKEVIEGAGEYLLLYCNKDWWNRLRAVDYQTVDSLDLWLAHWGINAPSVECGMWQFQGSPLDKNIAYKDYPSIIGHTETPEVKPVEPPVVDNKPDNDSHDVSNGGVNLSGVALYASSTAGDAAGTVTGTYFAWSDEVINNRIRITNAAERIGVDGQVTGFVDASYFTSNGNSNVDTSINAGDLVSVINNIQYNGQPFTVYFDTYDVIQADGDRVVIGKGEVVTAAINASNLRKV